MRKEARVNTIKWNEIHQHAKETGRSPFAVATALCAVLGNDESVAAIAADLARDERLLVAARRKQYRESIGVSVAAIRRLLMTAPIELFLAAWEGVVARMVTRS